MEWRIRACSSLKALPDKQKPNLTKSDEVVSSIKDSFELLGKLESILKLDFDFQNKESKLFNLL